MRAQARPPRMRAKEPAEPFAGCELRSAPVGLAARRPEIRIRKDRQLPARIRGRQQLRQFALERSSGTRLGKHRFDLRLGPHQHDRFARPVDSRMPDAVRDKHLSPGDALAFSPPGLRKVRFAESIGRIDNRADGGKSFLGGEESQDDSLRLLERHAHRSWQCLRQPLAQRAQRRQRSRPFGLGCRFRGAPMDNRLRPGRQIIQFNRRAGSRRAPQR